MKTKHRIIGLVVLVALAVIIVPLFFARSGPSEKMAALSSHVPTAPGQPEIQQIAIPAQQDATAPTTKPGDAAPSSNLATQPLQATADNNAQAATSESSPDDAQAVTADSNTQATAQENKTIAANSQAAIVAAENEVTSDTSNSNSTGTTMPAAAANASTATANNALAVNTAAPAAANANATTTSNSAATPATSAPLQDLTPASEKTAPEKTLPRNKSGVVKHKLADEEGHQLSHHAKKHEKTELTTTKTKSVAELANAWSVQLGSFSQKENAEKLVKQLRAKGYAAYLHQAKSENGSISRVYVGPELKREKAEAMATKLLETLNLKGVVVKYDV